MIGLSNLYATLPEYAADPPNNIESTQPLENKTVPSTYKCKAPKKLLACQQKQVHIAAENKLLDNHIT
ncbi:hypothetical protein ACHAW6_011686 [Cyclotella cf. meneghiniana]